MFPRITCICAYLGCTRKSLNSQNSESLCSRSIRKFTLINSYVSRKGAKFIPLIFQRSPQNLRTSEPQNETSPFIVHRSSFNVHLRTSERGISSELSTFIVHLSSFTSEPQNFRTSERDISSELSSLIVQRSSLIFHLSFASLRELI